MVCRGSPLKKVGFQKKNGAKPHFVKIEKTITYQAIPIENSCSKDEVTDK
jgi:hypothetical protein